MRVFELITKLMEMKAGDEVFVLDNDGDAKTITGLDSDGEFYLGDASSDVA